MKADISLESEEKLKRPKKEKSYFVRLLEMQLRRTGSDRRRRIFGRDPLMPDPQIA
jgi:hypothetical protein